MTVVRVAVVGAGIAGLAVAAGLDRAGIGCVVYERARRLDEIGAGIQIGPNASRLLHRLGLGGELDAAGARPAAVEVRHWRTGATIARTVLGPACEAAYGAPYYTLHRADLHRALRRLVPRVELGRRCVGVDQDGAAARVLFEDATSVDADVVVGADGIRSAVRDTLVRDTPRFSGVTVYRGLAPGRTEPAVVVWVGPGQHCVRYPVSRNRINVVAVAPGPVGGEHWTEPGRVADVLSAYDGWHADVRRLLESLPAVTRWALHERPAPPHWCTGRIALAGDAAHPMLPFAAQGASQAIEDAATLAACLRGAGPGDVAAALRRYERLRAPRVARVGATVAAQRTDLHASDGPDRRARDRMLRRRMSLRNQDWLYSYDAEVVA